MKTTPFSPKFIESLPLILTTTWLRNILDDKVRSKPGHTATNSDIYCRTMDMAKANQKFWAYLESLFEDQPWMEIIRLATRGGQFVGVEVEHPNDIYTLQAPYHLIQHPLLILLLAGLFISGPFDERTADNNYWFPIVSAAPTHPLQLVMSRHPAESRLGPYSIELAEFDLVRHERRLYAVVWQEET